MIQGSLSPPPQMGNGGSPPAHLPSSTAPDDFWLASYTDFPSLAAKWMQPPACVSEHDAWMREWDDKVWDILATPDDWLSRGMQADLHFTATGEHSCRPLSQWSGRGRLPCLKVCRGRHVAEPRDARQESHPH